MGWVWIFVAVATLGLAGYSSARHLFRQPAGWPRTLAAAVLAWAWITAGLQALGAMGLLNRAAILAWSALGLAIGWGVRAIRPAPDDPTQPASGGWDLSATVALGLIFLAVVTVGAPSLLLPPKVVSDGPIYHLYFAARWWKAGRVFPVATPFGETAATYFPANGDLLFSGLMTLFGGDRPARIGQSPFLLLAGLSSFALARRLGVSASSAMVATAWFVSCQVFLLFSFEANVDTIFVAGYLAAVYFGVSYALDDGGIPALVLGGLAAGAAWGTKPTALVFIPPLLALGGLIVWRKEPSRAGRLRALAALALSAVIPAGFWYGRNLLLTGNPLYPLHVEALGRVWLRGWYRSEVMRTSRYYLPIEDGRAFVSIVLTVFDPRMMPVWIAGVAGAWSWGRSRERGRLDRWVWAVSVLAVANVAAYWLLIPYRTQQRFMIQALGLAAVPLGRLLDRGRPLRWAAVILLAAHLTTPQNWPIVRPGERAPWDLSEKIPSVAASSVRLPTAPDASLLIFVGIALGSALVAISWAKASRVSAIRSQAMALAVTGATVLAYLFAIDELTGGASRRVFPIFPDYQRAWSTIAGISAPAGTRIAYAGTNLPYYLMGDGLRNDVVYVNIDAHPDWLLHDYHLSARDRGDPPVWEGTRPGWDRIHPDYPAWLANLRAARVDLLVVARANPDEGRFNLANSEGFPIERAWAVSHPETFERVYPREGHDPEMEIFRLLPAPKGESATDRPLRRH